MDLHYHPALSNYDILLNIFEQFRLRGNSSATSRHTLAACARVCKTFSDPALSILWRRIDSLLVLLKLLEPTLRRVGGKQNEPYCLHGELLPTQFSRFQKHASYIRTTDLADTSNLIDPTVFMYLAHLNHGRPILPALQQFSWFQSIPVTAQLTSIVPKSLRDLYLHLGHRNGGMSDKAFTTQIIALLRLLTLELPFLETLAVFGDCHPSYIFPIAGFHQLCSLVLERWRYPLTFHQPKGLSGLERSSDLIEATKLITTTGAALATISTPARFQTLEELEVLTDLEEGTVLFAIMSAPMLRSLDLTFRSCVESKKFRRFLDFVCPKLTSCSHITLDVRLSHDAESQLLMYILTPLLMLKDLQSIAVHVPSFPPDLSLSDQDISHLAMAWPRAKAITLDYHCSSPPPLSSLIHFAQHCPDLKSLSLSRMDFSLAANSQQSYPMLSHGLIRLNIYQYRPITEPLAAAQFLDRIFPNLDSKLFRTPLVYIKGDDTWPALVDSLDALKSARECESVQKAAADRNLDSSK
ncbi:hypothetical protein A0H81_09446 [Grifola frondosa]|uniref:F-box domain-containing protein n=1 Tax=Grifola frondosa TaxID=5627 RepID=A0A1C7M264_GRIFR|nr:hypothetical protein A0H81_09446 [Grifola frondosa]